MELIKERIEEKVCLALLSANVEDGNLGDFIIKKYLNRSFWREQAHAIILEQKIIID